MRVGRITAVIQEEEKYTGEKRTPGEYVQSPYWCRVHKNTTTDHPRGKIKYTK